MSRFSVLPLFVLVSASVRKWQSRGYGRFFSPPLLLPPVWGLDLLPTLICDLAFPAPVFSACSDACNLFFPVSKYCLCSSSI